MIQLSATVEQLIREKMASGRYGSEEELLIDALHSLDFDEDDIDDEQAIQESLDDLARGVQGIPVDEAFAQLRKELGIENEA